MDLDSASVQYSVTSTKLQPNDKYVAAVFNNNYYILVMVNSRNIIGQLVVIRK